MTWRSEPRLDDFGDPHVVKRIRTTVSSRDADGLARVAGAGDVFEGPDGHRLQRMHNGVLVEADGYDGAWMTEIIRSLGGVHEPQEEVVFDAVIARLRDTTRERPRMIEFGSYWSYYSLWFVSALDGARAIGLEPDAHNLDVGRRNAAVNGKDHAIRFVHGAIGADRDHPLHFERESDGATVDVDQYDLARLLELEDWSSVDLVLADVQGFETQLIELSKELLQVGTVRFLFVSTHHNSISGDALTHQRALIDLTAMGAHVIAEHSVPESFSGDGLIVVSFDERDRDLHVDLSRARSKDSLFDEVEWELNTARQVQNELDAATARISELKQEISELRSSRSWRMTAPIRALTGAARRGSRNSASSS